MRDIGRLGSVSARNGLRLGVAHVHKIQGLVNTRDCGAEVHARITESLVRIFQRRFGVVLRYHLLRLKGKSWGGSRRVSEPLFVVSQPSWSTRMWCASEVSIKAEKLVLGRSQVSSCRRECLPETKVTYAAILGIDPPP